MKSAARLLWLLGLVSGVFTLHVQAMAPPSDVDSRCRQWVDSVFSGMSLQEKVGQLVVATLPAFSDNPHRAIEKLMTENDMVRAETDVKNAVHGLMVAVEMGRLDDKASAYGHTGFTGTAVWADPDSKMIYVFLSNRLCPNVWNTKPGDMCITKNIQELINGSLKK